jgi:hypothetical protein
MPRYFKAKYKLSNMTCIAKRQEKTSYLTSLNFSSASGDGFLSGWYCGTNDTRGEMGNYAR